MNLTNSLTSNSFKSSIPYQKNEDKKFETEQEYFENGPNVITDLIVSYLDANSDLQLTIFLNSPEEESIGDKIDNAKAFIFVGHWSKKNDLKLVGLNILYEIFKNFKNYNPAKETDEEKLKCLLLNNSLLELSKKSEAETDYSLYSYRGRCLFQRDRDFYYKDPLQKQTIENFVEKFTDFDFASKLKVLASNFQTLNSAIKINGEIVQFASDTLKDNHGIMVEATKQAYTVVCLASDRLKSDRDFALITVRINGLCLRELNKKFRSDLEIVSEALETSGHIFRLIDNSLKNDRKLALKAVKRNGLLLEKLNKELLEDPEILLTAVSRYPEAATFIPAHFLKNREIAIASVRNNGLFLKNLKEFKSDPEVVLIAVKNNPEAIKFASRQIWGNKEIMLVVVSKSGILLSHAIFATTVYKLNDDFDVVLAAVKNTGLALESASDSLKNDRIIVLAAVEQNPDALQFASPELQKDPEILTVVEETRKRERLNMLRSMQNLKSKAQSLLNI